MNGNFVFLLRSDSEATIMAAYRKALAEIAPMTPLLRFATLERQLDDSLGAQRLITLLGQLFGGLALFLSALGLYGLLAWVVAQRTREMGVRIAMGARRGNLLWLVMGQAGGLLLVGVTVGTVLAWDDRAICTWVSLRCERTRRVDVGCCCCVAWHQWDDRCVYPGKTGG